MKEIPIEKYINEKSEKSLVDIFKLRLKEISYFLTKKYTTYLWLEIIFITFTFLQLLSFPLSSRFNNWWKIKTSYDFIEFLKFFQIVPLFQDNSVIYYIALYLSYVLIIYTICLFIIAYLSNITSSSSIVQNLGKILILISYPLYLPILFVLLSITSCDSSSMHIYLTDLKCWREWQIINSALSWLFAIALFCISLYTITTVYSMNLFKNNQITSKTSSSCDVFFWYIKTLLVIIHTYSPYDWNSIEQWVIIIIYCYSGFAWWMKYQTVQPFFNKKLLKYYIGLISIFSWTSISWLISKILERTHFNSGWYLILCSLFIISLIFSWTSIDDYTSHNLIMYNKTENEAQHQINFWRILIEKSKTQRAAKCILEGYILIYEEHCSIPNCPWKQFSNSNILVEENMIYLYQHIEIWYTNAIDQYNNSIKLRIDFAVFWLDALNKKKNAWREWLFLENGNLTLEEEFLVYKYVRYIEQNDVVLSTVTNNSIITNVLYKKELNEFKLRIKRVSLLYMDFWSILLVSSQDNKEALEKLNNIGNSISKGIQEIDLYFEKWQNWKNNDKDTLLLYCDFQLNVVYNREKVNSLKSEILEIENDDESNQFNNVFTNENIDIWAPNALATNDIDQYIILSSQPDNFGVILNMSWSWCSMLGYSKTDIIGHGYDWWIPEIYLNQHNEILLNKVNLAKQQLMNLQRGKGDMNTKDISVYLINRAKYLVAFQLKVGIIANEYNDCFFVAKVIDRSHSLNTNINNINYSDIEVLISTDFIIQYFTVSAITALGWNSTLINNTNTCIFDYIKEFSEEFLNQYTENQHKSRDTAVNLKWNIQNSMWGKEVIITWKKTTTKMMYNIKTNENWKFKLRINEQKINGVTVGYIYSFTPMKYTSTQYYSNQIPTVSSNTNCMNYLNSPTSQRCTSNQNDVLTNFKNITISNINATADKNTKHSPSLDNNNNNIISVEKDFIPISPSFNLDPQSWAFIKVNKQNDTNQSKEYLKALALKKITETQNLKQTSLTSGKDGTNSSYDSYIDSESISGENSFTSQSNSSVEDDIEQKMISNEAINIKVDDNYYKVNMTNIKLSVFDFTKKILVEENYPKVSEIELKINHHNNDATKYKKKESNRSPGDGDKKGELSGNNGIEGFSWEIDKKELMQKQIENAWLHEESQPTIINLRIISAINITLIIGIGAAFVTIYNVFLLNTAENILIIQHGYDILVTIILGYYYVVELNWYNYSWYKNKPDNLPEGTRYIKSILLDYVNKTNDYVNYIITTSAPISKNISSLLEEEDIVCGEIDDKYDVIRYNLSWNAAYNELITSWYSIGISDHGAMRPTHKDNFYYAHNSCNSMYAAIIEQNDYFMDNINNNFNKYRNISIILFVSSVLIIVWCYYLWILTFSKVARKKETYWEVFFEIEKNLLQMFIDSCEYFNRKYLVDKTSDFKTYNSNWDKKVSDFNTLSFAENESLNEEIEKNELLNPDFVVKKIRNLNKNKNNVSKETKIFQIRISLLLWAIIGYVLIGFVLFIQYWSGVKTRLFVFQKFYDLNIIYFRYYNNLRSFWFDKNSFIFNEKSEGFLDTIVPELYSLISQSKNYVTSHISNYPETFISWYKEINEHNICSYGEETIFSKTSYTCDTFLDGTAQFGFDYMISSYITELIYWKNMNSRFEKNINHKFNYNWTLINTPVQNQGIPEEYVDGNLNPEYVLYMDNHQINVFNSPRTIEINYFYLNYLIPCFDDLSASMKNNMNTIVQNKRTWFVSLMIAFMICNLAWFILIFVPFINKLSDWIYKTKNMLIIIPKQILCNIPNILGVLNIVQSIKVNSEEKDNDMNYSSKIPNYQSTSKGNAIRQINKATPERRKEL